MQEITLQNIESSFRFVSSRIKIPSKVLKPWIQDLDALLPEAIRKDQIEYSIAKASKEGVNDSDIHEVSIGLAMLLQKHAKDAHFNTVANTLDDLFDESFSKKKASALDKLSLWQADLKAHANKITVNIKPYYFPIILDQVLRWVVLFLLGPRGDFDAWQDSNQHDIFLLAHIIIIPIITIGLTYFSGRKNQKRNEDLLVKLNLKPKFTIKQVTGLSHYFLLLTLVLVAVAINYVIYEETYDWSDSLSLIILWVSYLAFFQAVNHGRLTEEVLGERLASVVDYSRPLDPELNDEVLVETSEKLRSITGRLEAYVLESALFGALAFSGFLQIMAENLVTFDALSKFGSNVFLLAQGIVHFDSSKLDLQFLGTVPSLYSLISIETLVCSILFLAVIASRLSFSNLADKIKLHAEIARSYNQKEEMILQSEKKDEERLGIVNTKIKEQLQLASNTLDKIAPVTGFMRVFRNGGIVTFLIVLITSALLVSPFLSLIFSLFSVGVLIYFNIKSIHSSAVSFRFWAQYIMINYSRYLLGLGFLFILIGSLLSIFLQYQYFQWPIGLGLLLLVFYRMSKILIIHSDDEQFEGKKPIPTSLKFFWVIGELGVLVTLFQVLVINGGFEFAFIGAFILIFTLPVCAWYLTARWWVLIPTAALLSYSVIGLMNLISGGQTDDITTNMIDWIPVLCLSILFFIIYFRRRSLIHSRLKNLVIGLLVFLLYAQFILLPHQLATHLQTSNSEHLQLLTKTYIGLPMDSSEDIELLYQSAEMLKNNYHTSSARVEKKNFSTLVFGDIYWLFWSAEEINELETSESKLETEQTVEQENETYMLSKTDYDSIMKIIVLFDPDKSYRENNFFDFEKFVERRNKYYGIEGVDNTKSE